MCGHRGHRGRERTFEDWTPRIDEAGVSAASGWVLLACLDIWGGVSALQLEPRFLGEGGNACFVGEEGHGGNEAGLCECS